MKNNAIITIITALTLASCGGSSSGSVDEGTNNTVPQDSTTESSTNTDTSFSGTWYSSCSKVPMPEALIELLNGLQLYQEETVTNDNGESNSTVILYTDEDCTSLYAALPDGKATARHRYAIGNQITTTGGFIATEIDAELIESSVPSLFEPNAYTISYVNGDILYGGDVSGTKSGSSPDLRPDTLDLDNPFYRQ